MGNAVVCDDGFTLFARCGASMLLAGPGRPAGTTSALASGSVRPPRPLPRARPFQGPSWKRVASKGSEYKTFGEEGSRGRQEGGAAEQHARERWRKESGAAVGSYGYTA